MFQYYVYVYLQFWTVHGLIDNHRSESHNIVAAVSVLRLVTPLVHLLDCVELCKVSRVAGFATTLMDQVLPPTGVASMSITVNVLRIAK